MASPSALVLSSTTPDYSGITAQISAFMHKSIACAHDTSSANLILSAVISIVRTQFAFAAQKFNATHDATIYRRLPPELHLQILSWLETDARVTMTRVSKYFQTLCLDHVHLLNSTVHIRPDTKGWIALLNRVAPAAPLRISVPKWPTSLYQRNFLLIKLRDAEIADLSGSSWTSVESLRPLPALRELRIRTCGQFTFALSSLTPNLRVLRSARCEFVEHPGVMSSLKVLSCAWLDGVQIDTIWEVFPHLVELCIERLGKGQCPPSAIPPTLKRLRLGGPRDFASYEALPLDQILSDWTPRQLCDVAFWNIASTSAVLRLFSQSRMNESKSWKLVCSQISKTSMTGFTTESDTEGDMFRMILCDEHPRFPPIIWRESFSAMSSGTLHSLTTLELVDHVLLSLIESNVTLPSVTQLLVVLSTDEQAKDQQYAWLSSVRPEIKLHLPILRQLVVRAHLALTKQAFAIKFVTDEFPRLFASRADFVTANVVVEWITDPCDGTAVSVQLAEIDTTYRVIARAAVSTVSILTGALNRPCVLLETSTPHAPRVERFSWVPAAFD